MFNPVIYSGNDVVDARNAMLDYQASRDSDLEILYSRNGRSLVEGYMPAVLAQQLRETGAGKFSILSEGEGFAEVDGWIPTDKARALATVMRAAA